MLIEAILFAVTCAVLAVALCWFLPRAFQLAAIYGLHDLRDQLFIEALERPELRDKALYRDAEFLLTLSIHVCRDRSYGDSVDLFGALRHRRDKQKKDSPRVKRYLIEIQEDPGGHWDTILGIVNSMDRYVSLRVAGGHPVALLLLLVSPLVIVLYSVINGVRGPHGSLRAMGVKFKQAAAFEQRAQGGFA